MCVCVREREREGVGLTRNSRILHEKRSSSDTNGFQGDLTKQSALNSVELTRAPFNTPAIFTLYFPNYFYHHGCGSDTH